MKTLSALKKITLGFTAAAALGACEPLRDTAASVPMIVECGRADGTVETIRLPAGNDRNHIVQEADGRITITNNRGSLQAGPCVHISAYRDIMGG